MRKIYLIIGVHNHQPVGNFPFVFEEAYQKAYLPFLTVLEKHPRIKITLHYSGVLIKWIEENHFPFLEKVKKLIETGQVELMSGGFYEPVLSVIPDRDKLGQIKMLTEYIEKKFGYSPKGIWLAERIWEPHLPKTIFEAGLEYTVLDESHFIYAGLEERDIFGYYLTEEQGKSINLFPISKALRYLIPFKAPEEAISYLKAIAQKKEGEIAVIADDGEKFGIWPGTHKWVYKEKWLDNFFSLLEENRDWIELLTFSECLSRFYPKKLIYLPTASYEEMMEWVLPYSTGEKYEEMTQWLSSQNKSGPYKRFFKGGFFRNYFFKYPEANLMHKKMLYVSQKVEKAVQTSQKLGKRAQDELWKGQCNCAYWHGVFGGLYLGHLRASVYEHLIRAEKIADKIFHPEKTWIKEEVQDLDKDGRNEILLSNDLLNLYIDPQDGGCLWELDYKLKEINLLNTLTRRPETYHHKIRERIGKSKVEKEGIPSIHELSVVKQKNLATILHYDWYKRASLLDHFLASSTTREDFRKCRYAEKGDFVNQPYAFTIKEKKTQLGVELKRKGGIWVGEKFLPLEVKRVIWIGEGSSNIKVGYELFNPGEEELFFWFGVEFNPFFLDPDAVTIKWEKNSYGKKMKLSTFSSLSGIEKIRLEDHAQKVSLSFSFSQAVDIWQFPLETVSQSESGFEKSYQGSILLPQLKFRLKRKNSWGMNISLEINSLKNRRGEDEKIR